MAEQEHCYVKGCDNPAQRVLSAPGGPKAYCARCEGLMEASLEIVVSLHKELETTPEPPK